MPRNLTNEFGTAEINIYTGSVEAGLNLNSVVPDNPNSDMILNVNQALVNISSINASLTPPVAGTIAITDDITTAINNIEFPTDDIPTKTSELINDSGFITDADVPTKTSQLVNDSGFIDSTESLNNFGTTSINKVTLGNSSKATEIYGSSIQTSYPLQVKGNAQGVANIAAILFKDITGANTCFVGDASSEDSDLWLKSNNADVRLEGTNVKIINNKLNNITIPTTTSGTFALITDITNTEDAVNFGTNNQVGTRILGNQYNQTNIIGDYIKIGGIDVPQDFAQGSSQTFALRSDIPSGGSGNGFEISGTTATAPSGMSEYIFSSGSGSTNRSCIMTIKSDTDNSSNETANCQLLFSKENDQVQGYIGMGIPNTDVLQNQMVIESVYAESGGGYVNLRSQGELRAKFGPESYIYTDLHLQGTINDISIPVSGGGDTFALLSDLTVDGAFTNPLLEKLVIDTPNEALTLKGSGVGSANAINISFRDNNDLRNGFIGKGSPSNNDIYLYSDLGGIQLTGTNVSITNKILNGITIPTVSSGTFALLSDITASGGIAVSGSFPNKTATFPQVNKYLFSSGVGGNGSCILTLKSDTTNTSDESNNCQILFSKENDQVQGYISMGIPNDSGETNNDLIIDCVYDSTLRIRSQGIDKIKLSSVNTTIGTTNLPTIINGNTTYLYGSTLYLQPTNLFVYAPLQSYNTAAFANKMAVEQAIGSGTRLSMGQPEGYNGDATYLNAISLIGNNVLFFFINNVNACYVSDSGGFVNNYSFSESASTYTENVMDKFKLLQIKHDNGEVNFDFDSLEEHFLQATDRRTISAGNEVKGIKLDRLVPHLVKANLEQQEEIDTLKSRLDLLEEKLNFLTGN